MSLQLLADTAPNWISDLQRVGGALTFKAAAARAGNTTTRTYDLSVTYAKEEFSVGEAAPGSLLPAACPERHINPNGSFCLGLDAGKNVVTADDAQRWWNKVALFLSCQETARRTGMWPRGAQLSHDTAGRIQLLAEQVAADVGLVQEYAEAVQYKTGPISLALRWYVPSRKAFLNGRAACFCGRTDRRRGVKLRRQCRKHGDPCVVILEALRREALRVFWLSYAKAGKRCCGTISDCPLRDVPEREMLL